MKKTIYNLELHENLKINSGLYVTRVPGGWLYEIWNLDTNECIANFIPFNNEFQKEEITKF